MTHQGERNPERSWEDREKKVIELLTLYRNAKCVVTKRLHCALPCLAQETPVLLVKEMVDDIRFSPYYDFLHWTTVTNFMNNNYEYDFINPPQNKTNYKHVREDLEKSCIGFIEKMEKETGSVDELNRFNCTDKEIHEWQFNLMDETLHKWLYKTRADSKETRKLRKEIERLKKENEKMKKENEKLLRIVNSKTVRYARKIRKVIRG